MKLIVLFQRFQCFCNLSKTFLTFSPSLLHISQYLIQMHLHGLHNVSDLKTQSMKPAPCMSETRTCESASSPAIKELRCTDAQAENSALGLELKSCSLDCLSAVLLPKGIPRIPRVSIRASNCCWAPIKVSRLVREGQE